jgi:hypothetical protein
MLDRIKCGGMRTAIACALIAIVCFGTWRSYGQKKTWQSGTIQEVKAHQGDPEDSSGAKEYDISIKVGKKLYVVLYVLDRDKAEPDYYVGMERPVLIEDSTLKFNDLLGRTRSLRILSSKDAPPADSK